MKPLLSLQSVIACLIASTMVAQATPRRWQQTDGHNAQGDFLARDATTVTIRRPNGTECALPLDQLAPDDRTWLNQNHPLPAAAAEPNKPVVFDQLSFGDTREQVLAKLKASKFVELGVDETFLGRSGLNGVFHTRQKIGGLSASLFFDWTGGGELKELTVQTDTLPASDYQSVLKPSWQEFINLLSTLYGQPVLKGSMPGITSLTDGTFYPSHLWYLESGGSALLGAARDGDKYQVVVRFTRKKVLPTEFR